ncbi:MAG: group III truncated hemoglobin [Cyclobacteriaceae bacterium]|nr:group III truncated hemoglobin [Cyclobacteriaceae bacterium]
MRDITSEEDVKLFIDAFYEKVKADAKIGYIFNEVADLNWEEHMPKIYRFWESILLGKPGFQGDVMGVHIRLNKKEKLTSDHFDKWIALFTETVREMYDGSVANEAINRANIIRRTMEYNILQSR